MLRMRHVCVAHAEMMITFVTVQRQTYLCTAMERMGLSKKRMVYPVEVQLDNMLMSKSRMGSWCDGDISVPTSNLSHTTEVLGHTTDERERLIFIKSTKTENLNQDIQYAKDIQSVSSSSEICSSSNYRHILHSDRHLFIQERIQHLVQAFTERAQRIRRRLDLPPTPSTASSEQGDNNEVVLSQHKQITEDQQSFVSLCRTKSSRWKLKQINWSKCIDPQSYIYIYWLLTVTLCFAYNCCVIPLRSTFPYQHSKNTYLWLICDYIADLFYLLDIIFIRPRVMYLEDDFWVKDLKLTRRNYMRKWEFKMDILSLLPFDLLYYKYGYCQALLRIPRFFKVQTFWELYNCMDSVLSNPHVVRIARTLSYMVYLIHVNACAYYAFSTWEGLGSNGWVFNGVGNAYIRCFYFATKTATSIGKNPKPENEYEYMFMTVSWLMGVFVFALLIGQIRDIITTATYSRTEYRKLVDETLEHMRRLNLPQELQERVKLWFTFTWEQQHTLDERRILDSLPIKMKTDIAINVHIQTLSKVQLFYDCDEALLRELVLKLRSVIYLPGDTICRKGEVGKEMYIVKTGQVQVLGGLSGNEVLATLTEGSVFGEISLLAINGGNRRTADVRSHGFSNLFVLNKSDLNEAIQHYPHAQEILRKKARSLMRRNAAHENRVKDIEAEVIKLKNDSVSDVPRLIKTVLQVVSEESMTAKLIKYDSQRKVQTNDNEEKSWKSALESNIDSKRHQIILESNNILPSYFQVPVVNHEIITKTGSKIFRPTKVGYVSRPMTIASCFRETTNNNNTDLLRCEKWIRKMASEPCLGLKDINTFQCMVTVHREMY